MSDTVVSNRPYFSGATLVQRLGALVGEAVAIAGQTDALRESVQEEYYLDPHARSSD